MKLRNKRTGEVGYLEADNSAQKIRVLNQFNDTIAEYNSLADIENEWESYEEPKLRWYSGSSGIVHKEKTTLYSEPREIIGNSFETEKEAEKAVEKLKAWYKLMGYWETEVLGWEIRDMPTGGNWQTVNVKFNVKARKEPMELLDILFGGEE